MLPNNHWRGGMYKFFGICSEINALVCAFVPMIVFLYFMFKGEWNKDVELSVRIKMSVGLLIMCYIPAFIVFLVGGLLCALFGGAFS
jgi:hypothetical protein